MQSEKIINTSDPKEDLNDFLEYSLCGFVTTNPEGIILQANSRFVNWIGRQPAEVIGHRFSDFLTIGGKIYFETHLSPLLRIQQHFDEVALELSCIESVKMPVLINAYERRDDAGVVQFVRLTIFKAVDRRSYEQNLRDAKTIAELNLSTAIELSGLKDQFIAVLGHDLRNPLGAITAGVSILTASQLSEPSQNVVKVISRSASRMAELITNIMDFARTRLGGGIMLQREMILLTPVLTHVVNELKIIWPQREIIMDFEIDCTINCDKDRVAQVLSNLLSNAITHGAANQPVIVRAKCNDNSLDLSVINKGIPIPEDHHENLFQPFTRESTRPSQNGLGLGLYIAAEICRAHGGTLSVVSNEDHTEFKFTIPSD